jgi:hypothetical protein
MELIPSCEAASCAGTREFPNILWNFKAHYRVYDSPSLYSVSLRTILISSTYLRLCLFSGLFHFGVHINTLYSFFLFIFVLHVPYISISLSLMTVQVTELHIMQLSPTSCHYIPPRSKYSPQTLFLTSLSLCSFRDIRDQVPHRCNWWKSQATFSFFFCILIFAFLGSRREEK